MIGRPGRSRAVSSAVVPDWVKQQIALMSVVSAISRAAATIPSATVWRLALRLASSSSSQVSGTFSMPASFMISVL